MRRSGTYRRLYDMQFGDEGVVVAAGLGETLQQSDLEGFA
jgi:subfamily B ATP-binding cassette protein MsbA